jgi:hypothetical protein
MTPKPDPLRPAENVDFAVAIPSDEPGTITARQAGGMTDLALCVSPGKVGERKALQHLAKAINLALKSDFIETDLDEVYKAARVYKGAVRIQHVDYIGLGDNLFAQIGKTAQSFRLTFRGPDAGSPEGKEWIAEHGGGAISGILNLIARKLDFLQEFEDKLPVFTEQLLDRLEATRVITDWHRDEWLIETTFVGLDVILTPKRDEEQPTPGEPGA